jgi:hypothetical protein
MPKRDSLAATLGQLPRWGTPVAALVSSSCLVAAPPDLEDPQQTRPFVYMLQVQPPTVEPIRIELPNMLSPKPSSVSFSIPFQSEDLGERVGAELHLYGGNGYVGRLTGTRVPASDFNTLRTANLTWRVEPQRLGCYRLVAILAHESSFNDEVTDGFVKDDLQDDSESINWLANFYDQQENADKLDNCPRVGDVD